MNSIDYINLLKKMSIQANIEDADVQEIVMTIQKKILSEHKYNIWQGKSDKYWYTYIPDETKPNGRKKIKKKSREDIDKAIIEFYLCPIESKRTLENLFNEFIIYKQKQVSSATIKRMVADWKTYYLPKTEFINIDFSKMTRIDVKDFLLTLMNEHQLKNKAFNNISGVLKQTLEYAVEKEYIDKSPFCKPQNIGKKLVPDRKKSKESQVYSVEEYELIRKDMERRLTNKPSMIAPLAVLLLFETGLRTGELLALRQSDILYEDGEYRLHIQRQNTKDYDLSDINDIHYKDYSLKEHTKSTSGDRIIPLTNDAVLLINRIIEINKQYNNTYEDYLMVDKGKLITANAITSRLIRACERIGIKYRSPHKIRKTVASNLFSANVQLGDVSNFLGHAEESTTMKYYIFSTSTKKEADNQIRNALGDKIHVNEVTKSDHNVIQFAERKKSLETTNF